MKKKWMIFVMVIVMFSSIKMGAYASENEVLSSSGEKQVVEIAEGHTRITDGNVVTDDIITETYRLVTTVNGEDIYEYREEFGSGFATLTHNGVIIKNYDLNALRNQIDVWTMPTEDAEILDAYFLQMNSTGQTISESSLPENLSQEYTVMYGEKGNAVVPKAYVQSNARAAATTVKPYIDVTYTYPQYMYREITYKTSYSSDLGRYLSIRVKDSMYNYRLAASHSNEFDIGDTISDIIAVFQLPVEFVEDSLGALISGSGLTAMLEEKVVYYFKEEYNFTSLRQTYVYDYITTQSDISVYTLDGTGKISLTWDYVNYEYVDPEWRISAQAYPQTVSTNTMISEGQRIWEENILEYGYWKWGNV